MESYTLKKIVTFEDGDVVEIDVTDTSEIREVTKSDAIIEEDGYCRCYGCDREFNLYSEKEANEFYSSHSHLFDINGFEVYECDKFGADC